MATNLSSGQLAFVGPLPVARLGTVSADGSACPGRASAFRARTRIRRRTRTEYDLLKVTERRLPKMSISVALLWIAITMTACPDGPLYGPGENNVPPPPSAYLVFHVQLVAEPSGSPGAIFSNTPTAGQFRLREIRPMIPQPLPSPIVQTCTTGTDVVMTLGSGHIVTFGPCRLPSSIARLKRAMLAYLAKHS